MKNMGFLKGSGGGGGGRGHGGEIVQVQGGHILRGTGRKDRHSKVYTSKGPRDRRVRLSAHTAIQFYDVQDRLGFDRPSKAVDWLINKAKSSIDKLAELPAWDPASARSSLAVDRCPPCPSGVSLQTNCNVDSAAAPGGGRESKSPDDGYDFTIPRETGHDSRRAAVSRSSSLFPSEMDTTPFLATSSAMAASSSVNFDDYRSSNDQDLGLSLHPFQSPNFVQQHTDHHIPLGTIFPMTTADYPRFMFNPPPPLNQPLFLSQAQSSPGFLQRGTLQSSFAPPFRSYEEFHSADSPSSANLHHPMMSGLCLQSQMQPGYEHVHTIASGRPALSSPSPSPPS